MDDLQALPASPTPVPDSPAPPRHTVFLGRFGLRAGWSIAIFAVLFAVFTVLCVLGLLAAQHRLRPLIVERQQAALARQNHLPPPTPAPAPPPHDITPKGGLINEVLQFLPVALAAWILSKIERRRFSVYGIGRYRLHDVLPGAFWGLVSLSILVGLLRAFHFLVFDGLALSGLPILVFALKWLFIFFLVGLAEEYLMRGYLQFTLTRGFLGLGERLNPAHARGIAFWIAAFIMSVLFACLHLSNQGENFIGIAMVFVAGIVFSYALWQTGTLWWGIGFHMAWDWAQSFLYGVPDSGLLGIGRLFHTHAVGNPLLSGGHDGPEGSLLAIPILFLVVFAIHRTPRGQQPPLEPLPSASATALNPTTDAHPLIA